MKKQMILFLFILLAVSLLTLITFKFFFDLEPENLISIVNNNNNEANTNNLVSARDIKNVTRTVTSNASFPSSNEILIKDPGTISVVVIACVVGGVILTGGLISLLYSYDVLHCPTPPHAETVGLETFYNQ